MLPNFEESERFSTYEGGDYEKRFRELENLDEESKKSLRLVYGHLPFGVHDWLPGQWQYFTFFRDPVDRIISHYFYVREQPTHRLHSAVIDNGMTLQQYALSNLSGELDNGITRMLCGRAELDSLRGDAPCTQVHFDEAKQNLQNSFCCVGLVEEFDRSMRLLSKVFGWPEREVTSQNVTRNRKPLAEVDEPAVKAIRERNGFDLALYEIAKQRFYDLCETHGIESRANTEGGLLPRLKQLLRRGE